MNISLNRARISIQDYLDKYSNTYNDSMDKLSSGKKYSSMAENPVDYSMSTKLSNTVRRNGYVSDFISQGNDLLTIAEGAEETVSGTLQNIRDLCLQAADESYTAEDKDKILVDIRGKLESINSISTSTNYQGKKILDGTCTNLPVQISTTAGDTINIAKAFTSVATADLGVDIAPTVTGSTWTTDDIYNYMDQLDLAQSTLRTSVTNIGAYSTRLDAASDKLNNLNMHLTELNSYLSDTDVAEESARVVQQQILQQASVSILTQANQMAANVFNLLKSS